MSNKKYQAWKCTLVIDANIELPLGFDFPLRRALDNVMEDYDIPIEAIFSGWGEEPSKLQIDIIEDKV